MLNQSKPEFIELELNVFSTPKGKFRLLLGTLLWILIKLCIRKEEVTIDGI